MKCNTQASIQSLYTIFCVQVPEAQLTKLLGDKAALSKVLLRHVVPGSTIQVTRGLVSLLQTCVYFIMSRSHNNKQLKENAPDWVLYLQLGI